MCKDVSYKDLFVKYGWDNVDSIIGVLAEMGPDDELVLYQNMNFDSSRFGDLSLLRVGPASTFKSVAEAPPWLNDMPSQRKNKVGRMNLSNVRKGLEALDAHLPMEPKGSAVGEGTGD